MNNEAWENEQDPLEIRNKSLGFSYSSFVMLRHEAKQSHIVNVKAFDAWALNEAITKIIIDGSL